MKGARTPGPPSALSGLPGTPGVWAGLWRTQWASQPWARAEGREEQVPDNHKPHPSDPLTDSICHGEILSGEASPWLCHPGSDTEAEVGGQLGRGWGGEKCPSKGFEVGSVEWAREGRNLPPSLSGSGVEGSREGQLWPGRDWQEHEEDCSRGPIHCPGYSRGSRHLCAQKEPSYWGGDPEKTQASSGSQIDMHLRRKNGVSCVYRIWGDPGWS